jgi:hypothetical protein
MATRRVDADGLGNNRDRRKQFKPDTKVGVKRIAAERKPILELMCLDGECEEVLRKTSRSSPSNATFGTVPAALAGDITIKKE